MIKTKLKTAYLCDSPNSSTVLIRTIMLVSFKTYWKQNRQRIKTGLCTVIQLYQNSFAYLFIIEQNFIALLVTWIQYFEYRRCCIGVSIPHIISSTAKLNKSWLRHCLIVDPILFSLVYYSWNLELPCLKADRRTCVNILFYRVAIKSFPIFKSLWLKTHLLFVAHILADWRLYLQQLLMPWH